MKSFITSTVIFVCLILLIITNSVICTNITSELKEMTLSESIKSAEGVENLEKYWQKHKDILHLGVNMEYTDAVTESISSLKASVETQSEADFTASLNLLKLQIEKLEILNRISWENVL